MASPTKPARPVRKATRPSDRQTARPPGDYGEAFPNSKKIYVDGPQGIRVPMREIAEIEKLKLVSTRETP